MGSRLRESLGPHSSFLGMSLEGKALERPRAVIVPAPYDGTTTYRSGTREGPRAILNASRELEFFDEETCTEVFRCGIATLEELPVTVSSPKEMVNRVREIGELIFAAGKLPVLLGGEHLLSLGMIEAAAAKFPKLSVLHLDAHADLREEYQGSSYSNACVMRQVTKHASIVQVGIRSLSREEHEFVNREGIPCFYAHRLREKDHSWQEVVEALRSPVYISIDLDVFDPSIMPAVGTPEPGGLGWYDVLDLLKKVIGQHQVVGVDVMELMPLPHFTAPDFLAARLVYKILSYIFMDNCEHSLLTD